MKNLTEEFKNYRLIHNFIHEEPLKAWVNEGNFNDIYKEDWNVLMDVVDKIERLERDNQKLLLELTGNRAKIIGEFGCRYFEDSIGETKIEATYKAVVEFIKWYNKQKK